jgi:dienelactone hydrolase
MTATSSRFTCAESRASGGPRTLALGRAARAAGALAAAAGLATATAGCGLSTPAAARADPRPTSAAAVPQYAVGERVMTFVDKSRTVAPRGRRPLPRRPVTVVRYPEATTGPVGLVVFGHGYAVTPAYYFRLLRTWAEAGYVVAAPVFPLSNLHAPGGPDEADIVNQPRDISFVITRLLAASAGHSGPLAGLIDPDRVAVAGQSDGAETALAVASASHYRDPRVKAAIILSGAEMSAGRYFAPGTPPLLATQGTADRLNRPHYTYAYFAAARRPKFLLKLLGAGHLAPYTSEQPQLGIVERVTIDFLNRYLDGDDGAADRLAADGEVSGISTLTARP